MKKKVILALTPDKGFGGAERVFNRVNNTLLDNYEVHECFFNTNNKTYYESNCKEHSLEIYAASSPLGSLKNFILRILRFRKLSKELNADITISHLEGADFVSILAGTKAKKICVIHGTKKSDSKIRGLKGIIRKLMIKYLYAKADKLVTVSEALKKEMIEETKIKSTDVHCIYNEINQNIINQKKLEEIDDSIKHIFQNNILLTNSRLDNEQKNLLPLIRIFKSIKEKNPKYKLVMTGDGPDREKVIQYAKDEGLKVSTIWEENLDNKNSDLYFLGFQSNPFNLIYNSKALLLTSNYEGFPMGLIEALACYTLIFSADCPTGPSEILNGKEINNIKDLNLKQNCGVLLNIPKLDKSDSIEKWSNIILQTLDDENLISNLKNNKDITLNKIKPEVILQKWINLIESLDIK